MDRKKNFVIEFLRVLLRWSFFRGMALFLDILYDLFRYLRYGNSLYRPTRDRQKMESLIFLYYHKIEKALAMPLAPNPIGFENVEKLIQLIETWVRLTGETDSIAFRGACATLVQYRQHIVESLTQKDPGLIGRIDKILHDYSEICKDATFGGTITVDGEQLWTTDQGINFDHFVCHRHTSRTW